MNWILASGSPRRKEILQNLGVHFEVITADIEETCDKTDPAEIVCELAARKASAVAERIGQTDRLIVAADTLVACDGNVLGKPADVADATAMLQMLSGRTHEVFSGISLILGDRQITECECTAVTFDKMTDDEIAAYIASGEPFDKAGGYAVQGKAAVYIQKLDGCYFNVVGLPVHRLYQMLQELEVTL